MSTLDRTTIQFPISADTKRRFEEGAQSMHLSQEAYFAYLIDRAQPGVDASRLDRHVQEVFGKHGDLMRRLAK
jgi:hypothetical protein